MITAKVFDIQRKACYISLSGKNLEVIKDLMAKHLQKEGISYQIDGDLFKTPYASYSITIVKNDRKRRVKPKINFAPVEVCLRSPKRSLSEKDVFTKFAGDSTLTAFP